MTEWLKDIGEFGLIERMRARMPAGRDLRVGPGDDAAVIGLAGASAIATTDLLVEGVHFDPDLSSWPDIGFKAIAVNVSDIAAMAGVPRFALVGLGAPPETPLEALDGLAAGIAEACEAYAVGVAGGDVVSAGRIVLAITLLGDEGPHGTVLRSGARAGDALCVTGALGEAAAGLALLRQGGAAAEAILEQYPGLAAAHRRGRARVAEAVAAAGAGATAMIDLSDGLASDAGHIAERSGAGIEIDAGALPLGSGVAEAAAEVGTEPLALALGGGEDFEIAFAIAPENIEAAAAACAPLPVTRVGTVLEEGRFLVTPDGRRPLEPAGWDHFSAGEGRP